MNTTHHTPGEQTASSTAATAFAICLILGALLAIPLAVLAMP